MKTCKAVTLLALVAGASARSLRGLQETTAPTIGCRANGTACSLTGNALETCCNQLVCVIPNATAEAGVCQIIPTPPPTPAPTPCPCRNETQTCVDDLIGSDTCCNGLYCSAAPGSGLNGTCIKPTPAPTPAPIYWDIPGTVQAGGYNSYVDVINPNSIGGPQAGNGSAIAYILADESATYGINVTAPGSYGIQYDVSGSGYVDQPELLAYMTKTQCNDTAGRFGAVNITTFSPTPQRYPAGQVDLNTTDSKLTVCFDAGTGAQVNAYVFGLPVIGNPITLAPTSAPTPAPTNATAAPTVAATNATVPEVVLPATVAPTTGVNATATAAPTIGVNATASDTQGPAVVVATNGPSQAGGTAPPTNPPAGSTPCGLGDVWNVAYCTSDEYCLRQCGKACGYSCQPKENTPQDVPKCTPACNSTAPVCDFAAYLGTATCAPPVTNTGGNTRN